jgi:hypothetical protein
MIMAAILQKYNLEKYAFTLFSYFRCQEIFEILFFIRKKYFFQISRLQYPIQIFFYLSVASNIF